MAAERLSMRKIREILRQRISLGRTHREIAQSIRASASTVGDTLRRATQGKLEWAEVERLDDDALEKRLYVYGSYRPEAGEQRPLPDPTYIHTERKRPGVTMQLLHLEYLEKHPCGYRYSQFCEVYRRWLKKRGLTMRQVHRAGEKLFTDYSGKKPHITDPKTGECVEVELFVAALGASNFTYAESTRTQSGPDWIRSHVHTFEYLGGVPGAVVPDQLKSGVTVPCRYEPGIQRTYEEMAAHYGTTILPARPAKSRDKAKVEVAVQIAQRWILARLRNQTFFSLDEINGRIAELLEELNDRPMKLYGQSRRQLFEKLDRPALKALPAEAFVYGEWKKARVNIDYHIEYDHHYYSAHHSLVGEEVWARATSTTVEIFYRSQRHTSHARSYQRGHHTTKDEHMPKAHREHASWSPSRILHWAQTLGLNRPGFSGGSES